jgi:hypothetical protein
MTTKNRGDVRSIGCGANFATYRVAVFSASTNPTRTALTRVFDTCDAPPLFSVHGRLPPEPPPDLGYGADDCSLESQCPAWCPSFICRSVAQGLVLRCRLRRLFHSHFSRIRWYWQGRQTPPPRPLHIGNVAYDRFMQFLQHRVQLGPCIRLSRREGLHLAEMD